MGGRPIPDDAYFKAYCRVCDDVTEFMDYMGDDQCQECLNWNTNEEPLF